MIKSTRSLIRDYIRKILEILHISSIRVRLSDKYYNIPIAVRPLTELFRRNKTDLLQQYEGEYASRIFSCIRENSTVYDLGANVGYYTVVFANLVGTTGKVVAFEPDPSTFPLLKATINLNNINNVVLEQVAVGARAGAAELMTNKGESSIVVDNANNAKTNIVWVRTIKLDDYLGDYTPNFIKIDVEGFEYEVLLGAQELLAKQKPVVALELHIEKLKSRGLLPQVVTDILIQHGYEKVYETKTDKAERAIYISK